MADHMLGKMLSPAKSLSTIGTCVSALVGVSSPVSCKLGGGGESPGAIGEVARERFLSSMKHHVLLQPGGLVKLFEAYITLEGGSVGVTANVGIQRGLGVVSFLAVWHRTGQWGRHLLSVFFPHMEL